MSGFLTNLLARSVGPMSTIRPRFPSLFEPQRGAAELPVERPPRETAESPDDFSRVAHKRSNDVASDAIVRPANPVAGPEPQADPSASGSVLRAIASMPHPEALSSQMDTRQNGISESAQERLTPSVLSPTSDREPALPSDFGSQAANRAAPQDPPRFDSLMQPLNNFQPASVRGHIEASRTDANNPAYTVIDSSFQPKITRGTLSEGSPIAFRVDALAGEAKPTASDSRSSLNPSAAEGRFSLKPVRNAVAIPKIESASEPIVHVSIDRIEVRAVAPPAANPRADRAAQPAMSLKEYMRRRAPRSNSRESIS